MKAYQNYCHTSHDAHVAVFEALVAAVSEAIPPDRNRC